MSLEFDSIDWSNLDTYVRSLSIEYRRVECENRWTWSIPNDIEATLDGGLRRAIRSLPWNYSNSSIRCQWFCKVCVVSSSIDGYDFHLYRQYSSQSVAKRRIHVRDSRRGRVVKESLPRIARNQCRARIVHRTFRRSLFDRHHRNSPRLSNLLEQHWFEMKLEQGLMSNKRHVYQEYSKDEHV